MSAYIDLIPERQRLEERDRQDTRNEELERYRSIDEGEWWGDNGIIEPYQMTDEFARWVRDCRDENAYMGFLLKDTRRIDEALLDQVLLEELESLGVKP